MFFKLLVGYESGQIVLWDLRSKTADMRCQTIEPVRSIAWHHEGKQFMCSHADGSLTTWSIKQNNKPIHVSQPHGKTITYSLITYLILRIRSTSI